jgi:hypothetical protein
MIADGGVSKWIPRLMALLFCACLAALSPYAQSQKPPITPQTGQAGNSIRVHVGLVQTDVMVFDREGRFVPDLKPEQFELQVDEKAQPISFFELVSTGTAHDEEIWARAAGRPASAPEIQPAARAGSDAGRMILMFVDDWHMSADSMMRARTALAKLIDISMGVHDKAVIYASSGQLGFLTVICCRLKVFCQVPTRWKSAPSIDRPAPPQRSAFLSGSRDVG